MSDEAQRRIEDRLKGRKSRTGGSEPTPAAPSQPPASTPVSPPPPAARAPLPAESAAAPTPQATAQPSLSKPAPISAPVDREKVAQIAQELADSAQFERQLKERQSSTPVTVALMVLMTIPFLLFMSLIKADWNWKQLEMLYPFWNEGSLSLHGEPWRMVTNVLLCNNVFVFFIGMWFLWSMGTQVERLFGSLKMLLIFLIAGVGGSVVAMVLSPLDRAMGPLDAVYGLFGAWFAAALVNRQDIPIRVKRENGIALLFLALLTLLLFFVGNHGHHRVVPLGGLICGFLAGLALAPRLSPQASMNGMLRIAPWVGLVVVLLAGWAFAIPRYNKLAVDHLVKMVKLEPHLPKDADPSKAGGEEAVAQATDGAGAQGKLLPLHYGGVDFLLFGEQTRSPLTNVVRAGQDDRALPLIEPLLKDPNVWVKSKAALAQGVLELKDQKARNALRVLGRELGRFPVDPPGKDATDEQKKDPAFQKKLSEDFQKSMAEQFSRLEGGIL